MSRHAGGQDRLQVLYLGRSADVGALRRSLEAHGAVTRSRLTPEVAAVVTDFAVPTDHPTVHAAHSLGIPVLDPGEAIDRLAAWHSPEEPAAAADSHGGPVIAGLIVVLVVVMAALGILGSILSPGPDAPLPVNDSSGTPATAPR